MSTASPDFDDFVVAYAETALWSSSDDDGNPLDSGRDVDAIDQATWDRMRADCREFLAEAIGDLWEYARASRTVHTSDGAGGITTRTELAGYSLTDAAHDFWLTRNGHGAGFWDRGLPEDLGKSLTATAQGYGEVTLYVGDDGMVHQL